MHQYQVLIDLILIVILDVVFYGTHYTGARYLFELGKSIYLAIYQLQMEQIQDLPRSNSLQPDVVFYIRGFEYILGLPQQKNYLELFLSRSVLKRSEPSAVYKKHISRFFEYSSQITYSLGHELLVGQQGFFFHLGNFDIALVLDMNFQLGSRVSFFILGISIQHNGSIFLRCSGIIFLG